MQLSELREDIESLTQSLVRAQYLAASGQTALDLDPVFRGLPHVATGEAFGLVADEIGRSEGKRADRLKGLLHHVYRLIEDASMGPGARHAAELETVSGIDPGETFPIKVALEEVAFVEDREKRAFLERRAIEGLAAVNFAAARELEKLQATAQKHGYGSPMAAHAALGGTDLPALAKEAEELLASTSAMYEDVLAWWMRRVTGLSLFPDGAERHDLLHALALTSLEGLFPRGTAVTGLAGKLLAMGLSPLADRRIRIDGERRTTKTPAPFVAAMDPPTAVVAVFRPQRGYVATRDLLRSLGTAQHFANIDEARPFEDRGMGDKAVPLAIGELFASRLTDAKWLKRVLEAELPDLTRILGLTELARVRRTAAGLLHSMQVNREGPSASRGREYAERLSAAMCVAWPEGLWLQDADVRLGQADELRAQTLAIAWAEHLRDKLDEDWWRNPGTGPYLRKAFAQGQVESASQLAKKPELGPLSLSRVAEHFEGLLGR